jgi:hypothetical protein
MHVAAMVSAGLMLAAVPVAALCAVGAVAWVLLGL